MIRPQTHNSIEFELTKHTLTFNAVLFLDHFSIGGSCRLPNAEHRFSSEHVDDWMCE